MFKKAKLKPKCCPNPTNPIWHRTTNMEAMLLDFTTENPLSYSVVPKVIELSKELARDPAALDKPLMDRTIASYKLRFGLTKSMDELTLEVIRSGFFSLNLDAMTAVSLLKVDTESIYSSLCKYFGDNDISWDSLISIMMDSCNVIRGSKAGLETRICGTVVPHLLDIDGDAAHHIHHSAKQFSMPFKKLIENLCDDVYFDFKWSQDLREHLPDICMILDITYAIPERYVPHRWLSIYNVSMYLDKLWDALVIFYNSYLSGQNKNDNFRIVMEIYVRRQVSEASKEAIKATADTLRTQKRTEEGIKRRVRITEKLFIQQKLIRLILSFYHGVFPIMKSFVLLLQKKDPHIHHVEQLRFVKSFLSCFLRPQKISKSGKKLMKLDVTLRSMQFEDRQLILGAKSRKILKDCKKNDEWAINFNADLKISLYFQIQIKIIP